jgi:molybdenum cofactor cytidylyltransferase
MTAPTVLILASGRGERFIASGGLTHKLDALMPSTSGIPAKTVLQSTLDAVMATGLPYHVERENHAGMGDTIAAAVAKTQDAQGWLILPADMPLIDPAAIAAVADALCRVAASSGDGIAEDNSWIVVPYVHGKRGHPVGFPRGALSSLLALAGDEGAKSLFQKFKIQALNVDQLPFVVYPAGCLIDIDIAADLLKIKAWL